MKSNRMRPGVLLLAAVVAGSAPAIAQEPEEPSPREREEASPQEREEPSPQERAERVAAAAGHGYLGVEIREVDGEAVGRLNLPEERGARVEDVIEGSPAAEAGLRQDDVVVEWSGQTVESVAALRRLVRETPPGREVTVGLLRDGDRIEVEVVVGEGGGLSRLIRIPPAERWAGEIPEPPRWDEEREGRMEERMERLRERLEDAGDQMERFELRFRGEPGEFEAFRRPSADRIGVRVRGLTDQLAEYFGVPEGRGVLVASVREESPARDAGLRAGDVIVSVAGEEIRTPRDLVRAVRGSEEGPVEVRIVREGAERDLSLELPARPSSDRDTPGARDSARGPESPTAAPVAAPPAPPDPPAADPRIPRGVPTAPPFQSV